MGLLLLFMIIHLQDFRFNSSVGKYTVRPTPYLINTDVSELMQLKLFYTLQPGYPLVEVRDIYHLEFDLFANPFTALYYMFSCAMFLCHGCWGWQKLVGASSFRIPKDHQTRVTAMGWVLVA